MTRIRWALLCLGIGLSSSIFAQDLRLDQIHMKGTHNSYHQQPAIVWHPSHRYSHRTLTDQLEKRGIRAFEFDVHRPTFGKDLQVYHILAVDGKSSCAKFKDCLQELRNWSDEHSDHIPLVIWIEIKDATGGPKFANFDAVDAEIREVLGDRLLTPDDLQGSFASPRAAIEQEGWPLLSEARGRFLFILDDDARTPTVYLKNDSLKGRAMFVRATPETIDKPWAVVTKTAPGSFHSAAQQRNFLISDNLCSAEDEWTLCSQKLSRAIQAGTQILMDDFEGDDSAHSHGEYYLRLPDDAVSIENQATSKTGA